MMEKVVVMVMMMVEGGEVRELVSESESESVSVSVSVRG